MLGVPGEDPLLVSEEQPLRGKITPNGQQAIGVSVMDRRKNEFVGKAKNRHGRVVSTDTR